MNERLRARLVDVCEEARFSLDLVSRHGAQIETDVVLRKALERSCEIAGEALRAMVEHDPEIPVEYPKLPWREAIGLRTKLAHGYGSITPTRLIAVVEREFPVLLEEAEAILKAGPDPRAS
ncbi:MAG: HepT-like ribonuclease domain-containing protein [Oceanicaulis sp.]